jgi:ATP-dependent DNA helicase RecG
MLTAESDFWKTDITYLKGIGPKRAEILKAEADISTYEDLLYYFPRKYVDKTRVTPIGQVFQEGLAVTLIGKLGLFEMLQGKTQKRLTTTLRDKSGFIVLTWFQGLNWVAKKFKEGDEVVVYGKVTYFNGQAQMSHPEIELLRDDNEAINVMSITPTYPLTEKLRLIGLDSRGLRHQIHQLLELHGNKITESLPESLLKEQHLIGRAQALRIIHFPPNFAQLEEAKKRLKFEELFFFEVIMARRKQLLASERQARPFLKVGDLFNDFYQNHLPFELTNAQKRVIKEIRSDLGKNVQMNRLVQGDVGSGKTIVAIMCMLLAIDNGFQVAMMAPTEILAEQHFQNAYRLLSPLGLQVDMIVGKIKTKTRKRVQEDLLAGRTNILIGTHALIEPTVQFHNLGLVIVDEQHKFGVLQRAALWNKCPEPYVPHNLAMTATPIPRTLAMTVYGDVEISTIDELPPGRKEIKTLVKSDALRLEVFGFMEQQLKLGRQIYVVYPLVEESQKMDLLAVEAGYEAMCRKFPNYRIGIVHGKMKPEAKEFEMMRFKNKETHILVATTVIEVGVDVPNATVMVIENAERFGLSQLHQLRGRVGRGGEQSYAILMTSKNVSFPAQKRLEAMTQTTDGFIIAQIDLELRGPGDFLGTRQSGLPDFKVANILTDQLILSQAQAAAFSLIAQDPDLSKPEHTTIRKFFLDFITKHNLQDMVA